MTGRGASGRASRPEVVLAYFRLPHFVPIAFVMMATAALAVVIGGDQLSSSTLASMLVAMLGGQVVIGVVNELVDLELDRVARPDKPIAAGHVPERHAQIMGAGAALMMFVAGSTLVWRSFALLLAGTGMGIAYSLWFKRSRFAWLPYLAALPLLPIWVAVALQQFEQSLLLLYPFGALGALAVHVAQSVPDIDSDRVAGIASLPAKIGEHRSLALCWVLVLLTQLMALVAATVAEVDRSPLVLSAILTTGIVAANLVIYGYHRRKGVMMTFPAIAFSVGCLALAWVSAAA